MGRLNKLINWLQSFPGIIFIIIIFGAVIRILDFQNNWTIGNDDARDVMIALEAISRRELPMIGPFSSAGPFVTGPIYFWIVMVSLVAFPFGIEGPWLMLIILSILNILIFACIGFLLRGKKLAILMAVLCAASFQLINLQLNLTNPSFIPLFCSLLILFFILFAKQKKLTYIFLGGVAAGLAINMHYQAVNLLIFLPFILLIKGVDLKKKLIALFIFIIGTLIMLIPILWWDHYQDFSNINNILDYLLIAQYRIYVPNSWKIFLINDMPLFWGYIAGGNKIFGFGAMVIVGLGSILAILRFKKLRKEQLVYILPFIFFIMLFLNRYYHGQRSETYLLYLTPFVITALGLSFDLFLDKKLFARPKIVDFLIYFVFAIFILGNLFTFLQYYNKYNGNMSLYKKSMTELEKKFPNTKFSLYDRQGRSLSVSLPLSLIMARRGIQSENGKKISVNCIPSKDCRENMKPILTLGGFPVVDISTFSARQVSKDFQNVNEDTIYDSLIGWSRRHSLTHTFYLSNYLREKLPL